jgi:hypothetical protein
LFLSIIFNIGLYVKNQQHLNTIDESTQLMSNLLENVKKDRQLLINEELVHVIDSLQIMIFAYNLQYQEQLKTIQVLTHQPPKRNEHKLIINIDTNNIVLKNDSIK